MVMLNTNEWPSSYFFSDLIHALTGPLKMKVTDLNQDLFFLFTLWTRVNKLRLVVSRSVSDK